MAFYGFEADRNALKYRCPEAVYGFKCKQCTAFGNVNSGSSRLVPLYTYTPNIMQCTGRIAIFLFPLSLSNYFRISVLYCIYFFMGITAKGDIHFSHFMPEG